MREKAIVSWSGGKDSALALYEVAADYDIIALLPTVTSGYERISMHGVRTALLEHQAAALPPRRGAYSAALYQRRI